MEVDVLALGPDIHHRGSTGKPSYLLLRASQLKNSQLQSEPCSLYETQYIQQRQPGHTLRTVNTTYQSSDDPGGRDGTIYDVLAVVPTSVETVYGSSLQTWTAKSYAQNTFTFCDLAQKPGHNLSCAPEDGVEEGTAIYIGNPSLHLPQRLQLWHHLPRHSADNVQYVSGLP